MATSGKSKSTTYPYGKRRKDEEGRKLAPRSVRRSTDIHYLDNCDDVVLKKKTGMRPENVKSETKNKGFSV